jgi:hypothetical protein
MRNRCVPPSDMRQLLSLMEARDGVLDDNTAERLLQGRLPIDDAPPRYRTVVRVVALLDAPASEAELANETEAVAVISARIQRDAPRNVTTSRRISMSTRRMAQLAAASTIGAVSLFGGLAAANALPGAAQGVASDMLSKIGVSVPGPNTNAGTHPDSRGQSDAHPADASSSSNGQGSTISDLAHSTTATGVDKGAAISTAASDGKSHAGQHGQNDAVNPDNASAGTPPVETPNSGGTSTANTASDGHSTDGTSTANTASDGHALDGSTNADPGLSHKP